MPRNLRHDVAFMSLVAGFNLLYIGAVVANARRMHNPDARVLKVGFGECYADWNVVDTGWAGGAGELVPPAHPH